MSRPDFSRDEVPFAVGKVVGIRGWEFNRWNPDLLMPLSAKSAGSWHPGENVATCTGDLSWHYMEPSRLVVQRLQNYGRWSEAEALEKLLEGGEKKTLPISSKHCTCGFYAYWPKGLRLYSTANLMGASVVGLVEGYGHVTYGSEGFRASKARIIAFYNPFKEPPPEKGKIRAAFFRFGKWYSEGIHWLWVLVLNTMLGVGSIWLPFLFLLTPLTMLTILAGTGSQIYYRVVHDRRSRMEFRLWASATKKQWEAITAKYPGVPQYSSVKEMLAAHPLTDYKSLTNKKT